jgi:hypothetical protein
MAARKSHEEKAYTRTKGRSRRIRKMIEDISYDFFDSDAHFVSSAAEDLGAALDLFDDQLEDGIAEYREREAA